MKAMHFRVVTMLATLTFFVATPCAFSADAGKATTQEKPSDISARFEALEARIQKMEDTLIGNTKTRRSEVFDDWREFERQHFGQSFDNMMTKLQKEIDAELSLNTSATGNSKTTSRTDAKVSALQLSDDLAKDMKLTTDQRKKVAEVFSKADKSLTDDVSAKFGEPGKSNEIDISLGSDLDKLVDQHVAKAEKELAGIITADQIKAWQNYRDAHRSIMITRSIEIDRINDDSNTAKKSQ